MYAYRHFTYSYKKLSGCLHVDFRSKRRTVLEDANFRYAVYVYDVLFDGVVSYSFCVMYKGKILTRERIRHCWRLSRN